MSIDEEKKIISFGIKQQANDSVKLAELITKLWNHYATLLNDEEPIAKLFESKTIQPIFQSILTTVVALERLGNRLSTNMYRQVVS